MAKPFTVCALCIISTAVGAGIEVAIEQGAPHLQQAVTPKAAVAAPTDVNVEVLGDRVKCDVHHWRERYYRHYDRPEVIPVGS
jgi:hypothetical protein